MLPTTLNKGVHYFDTNFGKGPSWYRYDFPTTVAKRLRERRSNRGSHHGRRQSLLCLPSARSTADRRVASERPIHPDAARPNRAGTLPFSTRGGARIRTPFLRGCVATRGRTTGGGRRADGGRPLVLRFAHQHHSYLAKGLYLRQIQRWHALIPAEQLSIIDSTTLLRRGHDVSTGVAIPRLPEISLPAYEKMNAHSYDRMSRDALAFLRDRLSVPNKELSAYLGRTFPWGEQGG